MKKLGLVKANPSTPEVLDIGKEWKDAWSKWVQSYIQELAASEISDKESKARMDSVNPKSTIRNLSLPKRHRRSRGRRLSPSVNGSSWKRRSMHVLKEPASTRRQDEDASSKRFFVVFLLFPSPRYGFNSPIKKMQKRSRSLTDWDGMALSPKHEFYLNYI